MAILFSNKQGFDHLLAAGADPNKPAGLFSPLFVLAKRSGPLHRVVPVEERGSLEYVPNSHKVALFEALHQAGVRGEEEILTRAASARCKAKSQQLKTSSDADAHHAEALAWVRAHEYEAMKAYATRATKQGTSVKAFTLMGTATNLYSSQSTEQPAAQTRKESTSDCRLQ